jgi:hypothetical protein
MATDHTDSIKALIAALAVDIDAVNAAVQDAYHEAEAGRVDAAMGSLLPVADRIDSVAGIAAAVRSLHRRIAR